MLKPTLTLLGPAEEVDIRTADGIYYRTVGSFMQVIVVGSSEAFSPVEIQQSVCDATGKQWTVGTIGELPTYPKQPNDMPIRTYRDLAARGFFQIALMEVC